MINPISHGGGSGAIDNAQMLIRNVWADNLEREMSHIRQIIDRYPFIAMDTEFPGVVARPIGNFKGQAEAQYQTLRCNVDLLNIIQLGLTFSNEDGQFPVSTSGAPLPCTWQFHFKFNLSEDMYAQESIELLTKSGIDFRRHELYGISGKDFGDLLTSSGLVLSPLVKWISFHSGYDFGYLLKVLTCDFLPISESEFFELLNMYFPTIYDIKYLMKSCKHLKGGLQDVADDLRVTRIGPQHQAGSDSLLTASTFFQLRRSYFENKIDDSKFAGQLYGLTGFTPSTNAASSSMMTTALSNPQSLGSSSSSIPLTPNPSHTYTEKTHPKSPLSTASVIESVD